MDLNSPALRIAGAKIAAAIVISMGIERGSLEKRFDEYRKHDAIWLAGLIAKREISAEEVLEAAIARAEQVNPPGGFDQRHQHIKRGRRALSAGGGRAAGGDAERCCSGQTR